MAALLPARLPLRIALDDEHRVGGTGRLGENQFTDGVHPRIGMSAVDVGVVHPHLRIMEMQTRNHACGTDAVGDVTQVFHTARVLLAPAVVAARTGEIDVIDHHRAESAPTGVFDMGVDVFGRHAAQRIVRAAVGPVTAALDTSRQVVIPLYLSDGREQPLTRGDDERRPRTEQSHLRVETRIEGRRLRRREGVDTRPGMGPQQIDGHPVVPDYVEPLAEVRPRTQGQSQEREFVDLGLALDAVGLDAVIDALERKADVVVLDVEPDDGDVIGILEPDIEPVAAPFDPTGRKNARFGRIDQKILVIIGPVLRNRADRGPPPRRGAPRPWICGSGCGPHRRHRSRAAQRHSR